MPQFLLFIVLAIAWGAVGLQSSLFGRTVPFFSKFGAKTYVSRNTKTYGSGNRDQRLGLFQKAWDPSHTQNIVKKSADYLAFASYLGATATQFTLLLTFIHLVQIKIIKQLPNVSVFVLPSLSFLPFWDWSLVTFAASFPGVSVALPAAVCFPGGLLTLPAAFGSGCLSIPAITSLSLPAVTLPALTFPSLAETTSSLALGKSPANILVFCLSLFLAVRSRVFSPLNNARPKASGSDPIFKGRARPWFQPPPVAFPIIWSTIALLRAIASTIVFNASGGTLLSPAIFSLMLHLSVGDTWNTINNVERRMGTAALVVPLVFISAINAVNRFSEVSSTAAFVLAPMAVWLGVATLLVNSIWRLNYLSGNRPSLFPSIEEGPPCKWRMPFTTLNS